MYLYKTPNKHIWIYPINVKQAGGRGRQGIRQGFKFSKKNCCEIPYPTRKNVRSNITEIPHPENDLWSRARTKIQISLPPGQQDNSNALPPGQSMIDQIPALCPAFPPPLAWRWQVHQAYWVRTLYTLFTNGRQPGTSARRNMESRRFGIKPHDHRRKQVKVCLYSFRKATFPVPH